LSVQQIGHLKQAPATAIPHADLSKRTRWLLKCTRGHFKSVRLAGIALGCGIALDIGASVAAGAPAVLLVGHFAVIVKNQLTRSR
jgi:hypothetical protein